MENNNHTIRQVRCLQAILDYMKFRGLKQWEMANFLGCPETTLNRWLTNRAKPQNTWMLIIEDKLSLK